jgi:hypothetical protein
MSRPLVAAGIAILALGIVVLLVALVQGQRHVRSIQKELHRANEQIVQSKTAIADLEIARLEAVLMPPLERCHRIMAKSFAHLEARRRKRCAGSLGNGRTG